MLLYRLLFALALAAYAPYAILRSVTGRRRLGSLRGRLGLAPYPDLEGGVWVHAVSVGEVAVARNLLSALSRKAPGVRLGLSVTTAAGMESARKAAEEGVGVFSFPLDLPRPVARALSSVRPGLILLTETEIWPLLLDRASARGIPVALVNGRVSERSFRRYRIVRRWFARVLENIALFWMQTEEDAARMAKLGARKERIRVAGNIKYDLPPAPAFADSARLRSAAAGRPILAAGSTGEGEEEIILEAWRRLDIPRPLLALAPRRPERFDAVARLVESKGLTLIRRSSGLGDSDKIQNPKSKIENRDVYLLDSIGELSSLYREAFLAFLGGSLVPVGGHNPIEAWAQGVAVLVGPHTENFREATESGKRLGILQTVADGAELAKAFALALGNPGETAARGARAKRFVGESRGAADATADSVLKLLEPGPQERAAAP
jgi:3-deoxy-D-manno-octulosonic-acid transferase